MRTVAASTLAVHRRLQLPAVVRNAAGEVLDVPVAWQVADPTIATVDADGWVTAVAPGVTTVTATCGDVTSNVGVLYVHGPATAQAQSVGLTVTLAGVPTTQTRAVTTAATLLARRTQGVTASTHLAARRTRTATATASLLARKSRTVGATARLNAAVVEGSNPAPQTGDTIRLDTRTTLQSATNVTQALQAVSQPSGAVDQTGTRSSIGQTGWSFSTNFDGQGTRALVANLRQQTGDQGIHFINYLASPKPTRLYIQWKSRMGKHPSDPNANGTNDAFPLWEPPGPPTNPDSSNSVKRLLVLRDGVGGGDMNRWDYVWTRSKPTQLRSQIDHQNWSAENTSGWSAHSHKAEVLTTTVYFQAASANGVSNGVIRIWINGVLEFERTNVPAQANGFDRWQLPTVYHDVPWAAAEYLWDFLVWEPA